MLILKSFLAALLSILRSHAALELENLALRHQIGVLQRSAAKRPKLTPWDRLLWIGCPASGATGARRWPSSSEKQLYLGIGLASACSGPGRCGAANPKWFCAVCSSSSRLVKVTFVCSAARTAPA